MFKLGISRLTSIESSWVLHYIIDEAGVILSCIFMRPDVIWRSIF